MKKTIFMLSLKELLTIRYTHSLRITNEDTLIPSQSKPYNCVTAIDSINNFIGGLK
jgi:hypothetical protein